MTIAVTSRIPSSPVVPAPVSETPLRIAFLSYRSDPKVGGQGIFLTQAAAALAARGHHVDILSGPPYPLVPPGVRLVPIPSLDLFAKPHLGKTALRWHHLRSWTDTAEYFGHISGKFMEPWSFARRVAKYLAQRRGAYDIVLDNQSLSDGLLAVQANGFPVVAIIHHPIQRDLELVLASEPRWRGRLLAKRWYSFLPMQTRVARRLRRIIVVSEASKRDVVECFGVDASRISVVPLGIDRSIFRPRPDLPRHPARLVTTASADVPLKGLRFLIEAYARLIETRPELELVVVGQLKNGPTLDRLKGLGLADRVRFVRDLSSDELAALYASATLCVTPSLYEGFGLPAAEAMCSGTPVVVTDGGALPEIVGHAGMVVRKGDARALEVAIAQLLDNPDHRARMAADGLVWAATRFSWESFAAGYETIFRQMSTVSC